MQICEYKSFIVSLQKFSDKHDYYSVLNEILNCKRPLTAEYAMLLAEALQVDAEPLLTMQTHYDMVCVSQKPTFLKKLSRLAELRKVAVVL